MFIEVLVVVLVVVLFVVLFVMLVGEFVWVMMSALPGELVRVLVELLLVVFLGVEEFGIKKINSFFYFKAVTIPLKIFWHAAINRNFPCFPLSGG